MREFLHDLVGRALGIRRGTLRKVRLAIPAAPLVAAGVLALGCATESGEGLEDDAEGSADAISARSIQGYTAVSPPEHRVATADFPSRLGPELASGARIAVIRTLTIDGVRARLVVDVDRSTTSLVDEAAIGSKTRPATSTDRIAESAYARSLAELAASSKALESIDRDARIEENVTEPFALTIDMCQSRKPWDKRLFDWAVSLSDQIHAPVPLGIAMTGGWAQAHPTELDQLLAWQSAGKLAITWINHSSTHPLNCLNASCSKAEFLTAASVDFDEQVFGLERSLLARGMVPSTIFRFPGLIHDGRRLSQLSRLSLMPLDSDAWIAKGQGIHPRAVVLIHGNGNEPEGITGFLRAVGEPTRAANLRSGKSALVSPLLVAPVPPQTR
jgi:hypothetical protein